MTFRDAFDRGMDPLMLDTNTAERLVTGAVGVDDAPPRYRSVVRVLDALRADPDGTELAGPAAVDEIASAVGFEPRARVARHPRRRRSRAALVVAASLVSGVLLTGGLAAAGALPAPAQRVASAALSHIGISVPTEEESHAVQPGPTAISVPPATVAVPAQPTPVGDQPGLPRPVSRDVRTASPPEAAPVAENATQAPDPPPLAPLGKSFGHSPGGPPQGNGHGPPAESPPRGSDNGNGNENPNGSTYGLGNGNAHAFGAGNGNGP
jgi:hypothetical protein